MHHGIATASASDFESLATSQGMSRLRSNVGNFSEAQTPTANNHRKMVHSVVGGGFSQLVTSGTWAP